MDLIELFLIPFILFLGIITTYEDIKENKIRNKWVIMALLYSLLVFIGSLIYLSGKGLEINQFYIYDYFLNIFFGCLAGFIIWFGGLWPAGDAKLFIAYSALVPLSIYRLGYVQHFPSFIILINTFIPISLYYFFRVIIKTSNKEKILVIKNLFNLKFILETALFMFAFIWLIKLLIKISGNYTTFSNNFFLITAFLFLTLFFINDILKVNFIYLSIILSLLNLYLNYGIIFSLSYILEFLSIFIVFIFLRYFIINLGFFLFSRPVYIEDLKEGMAASENVFKDSGRYRIQKNVPISFVSGMLENSKDNRLFKSASSGLTSQEIKEVQELHSSGKIKEHSIMVSESLPFAPFMFLGVILSILIKGNLLFYLVFVLEKFI